MGMMASITTATSKRAKSDNKNPNDELQHELEPVHLLYDERMLLHRPIGWLEPDEFPTNIDECEDDYPMENPERIRVIYERLCHVEERLLEEEDVGVANVHNHQDGDASLFLPLTCRMATRDQILLAHTAQQYDRLDRLHELSDTELLAMSNDKRHDIYYCRETFQAAKLAAGGLLACVDTVCENVHDSRKAVALIRPPGHHACQAREMGFCFVDSVVIAAKYALSMGKAKKVAILDWDIHDGNGTAEATITDPNIFRLDIHRFNKLEQFYPYTGPPQEIGYGKARGMNLNMAWSQAGMGNTEYAAAFYELILPLLADFQPDLLIISCGLDAARGDLLGGCDVTPDFYHAMTRATLECVGATCPVVCALEGGYTMSVIPDCMEAVTLAMLHCPYNYHSSIQLGSYLGGAAQETKHWPKHNPLERSRKALSKYYVRDGCSRIIPTAIHDINTCTRIFKNIPKWNQVRLHRIKGPPTANHSAIPKKRQHVDNVNNNDNNLTMIDAPYVRPRVYLWYGTELHHQRMW